MSLVQALIVFFGIVNFTFGVFLYLNSKGRTVVKLYAAIIVFATLWSLATLLTSDGAVRPEYLRYAVDGHYIFGFLAYLSFFWFALLYPVPPKRSVVLAGLSITLASFAYLTIIPTQLFATLGAGQPFDQIVFAPLGYGGFIVMLSSVFFAGLLILMRTQRLYDQGVLFKDLDKYQIYFAILANFVAGTLGIVFNLIFPLYGNFSFFYINPILVTGALVVVGLYNILRYNLFNSRIILSEFFTGGILILALTRFILSPAGTQRIIDGILLVVMTGFGAFLIQSIFREVKLREQLVKQEKDLQVANQQQESLLHFISHEIKGYLTKNEAAFDAIRVGDYGEVSPQLREMSATALDDTRKGVATVIDILDASNLKRGEVSYKHADFDLTKTVEEIVTDLGAEAKAKGLTLTFHKPVTGTCTFSGDEDKLRRHVIRNVIDNSIKYTLAGSVTVDLAKTDTQYRITVKDTGVGITPEDMARLFTEGGHGKESLKVNVHSTGFGLYIAKQVTEVHGGKIWAESDGAGKGSRFIIELPLSL